MQIRKSFRYRLSPTPSQREALERTLSACRHLYNAALEDRRTRYRITGKSVSKYEQLAEIKDVRKLPGWEWLADVHVHPMQDAIARLDKAFKAFFRRIRDGKKPGFPRFKSKDRFNSFTFKEYGNGARLSEDGRRLFLSKVGNVRIRLHRPTEGDIKTATIKRVAGRWYAVLSCVVEVDPPDRSLDPSIGIDVGIERFLTTSEGEAVLNPRHILRALDRLKRAHRRLSRRRRGSSRRRKARKLLARAHAKVAQTRRDFHHKVARDLVNRCGAVAVEDLNTKGMIRNHRLAQAIADAGWAQFISILESKAEEAGTRVVRVDPRNTSQACSGCGLIVPKDLKEREHRCPGCLLVLQRDHNAAINILQRAGPVLRGGAGLPTPEIREAAGLQSRR